MAVMCSHCSHVNPDQSGFCVRCGNRLSATGQTGQFGTGPGSTSFPTFVSSPSSAPPTGNGGGSLPTYASLPPSSPPVTGPQPPSFPPPASYPPPTSPSAPWSTSTLAPPPPGPQMGSMQSAGSLRRAFAGHGLLIMHHSWLLTGAQAHANAVRDTFRDKLRQRGIPQLLANPEMLTERGLLMEQREYVVARRGVATVFTYVAPAGQDLYISRATTVLPSISNIRVAIVVLLALIMFIGWLVHPTYDPYNPGSIIISLLVSGFFTLLSVPILVFFLVFLVRSFIAWLVEKDFWQYLRTNMLNDFQLDDIALLEHVTDDVVHDAVEQVGLDATKITPPQQGYQPKPKIRAI